MEKAERYQELDLFRGIAIVMMVVFHTVFDLNFFGIVPAEITTGFWRWFALSTASFFLLIVGISLTISKARATPYLSGFSFILKFVRRGVFIFSCGLLVTFATWLYLPVGFVIFGILHLIGVSVMIAPVFFRFRKYNAVLGIVCIMIGFLVVNIPGPIWLLPLGIHPATFLSVDYTPLLPWFGMVLVGMGIGEHLYSDGMRQFTLPRLPSFLVIPPSFLGRYSLIIYLVHQPVIILVLHFIKGIAVW